MSRAIEEIVLKVTLDDSEVDTELTAIGHSAEEAEKKTNLLGDALKALGSSAVLYGLKNMGAQAIQVAGDFERVENVLRSTFVTQGAVASQMQFVSSTASKLGINILKSAEGYANLASSTKIAGLSTQDTQDIFEATATAAAALGLSGEDVSGVLKAFAQSAAKGKVQGEELMQMADRSIPIHAMMADALGVSREKLEEMAQKGEILATDALPKMAQAIKDTFHEGALANANSTIAKHERGLNTWQEALRNGGSELRKVTGTVLDIATPAWNKWIDITSDVILELAVLTYGIDQVIDANKLAADSTKKFTKEQKKKVEALTEEQKQLKKNFEIFKEYDAKIIESAQLDLIRKDLNLTEKGFRKVKDAIQEIIKEGGSVKDATKLGGELVETLQELNQLKDDDSIKSWYEKNVKLIGDLIGDAYNQTLDFDIVMSTFDKTGKRKKERERDVVEDGIQLGTTEAAKFLSRPIEEQKDEQKKQTGYLRDIFRTISTVKPVNLERR